MLTRSQEKTHVVRTCVAPKRSPNPQGWDLTKLQERSEGDRLWTECQSAGRQDHRTGAWASIQLTAWRARTSVPGADAANQMDLLHDRELRQHAINLLFSLHRWGLLSRNYTGVRKLLR